MKFLFIFICTAFFSCKRSDEDKAIKQVFDKYKSAVLADRGTEAIQYLDKHTIDYYSKMLDLTKKADSSEVDKLNVLDKLMVLIIRFRTTKEELAKMDGKSLLEYAFKNGMIGKESVQQATLGKIKVNGEKAEAQFVSGGKQTPLYFEFFKESGEWKLDITSVFDESIKGLEAKIKETGMTENEFVMTVMESKYEEPIPAGIWDPAQ